MEDLRNKAKDALERLLQESTASAENGTDEEEVRFWIQNSSSGGSGVRREKEAAVAGTCSSSSCSEPCRFFQVNGFVCVPAFCGPEECRNMKACMLDLVRTNWNPEDDDDNDNNDNDAEKQQQQELDSFGTNAKENQARGDYFLNSAENVHYFAESCSLEEEQQEGDDDCGGSGGGGNRRRRRLRPEYRDLENRAAALNKAGHALHLQGVFREYSFSDKVFDLVNDLGWRDPVVPQSMYIFKQPRIGGDVTSHQDSTFLFTEPRQTCLGLWLALDDATLENGALWVRPKSHREPVRRQYKRNPAHFGRAAIEARSNEAAAGDDGDLDQPKLVMEELYQHDVSWDGGMPGRQGQQEGTNGDDEDDFDALWEAGFVPVECRAGDLLAFCGELDHLSLPNRSDKPRHTFQLHLVEGPSENVVWSTYNWLQYSNGKPFPNLNAERRTAETS